MAKTKDESKLTRSTSSPRDKDRDEGKKSKSRKRKDEDDKKLKPKKSHKSKRHSDKDKKSGEKRKDKSRRKHDASKLKIEELSVDDYFVKSNEFAKWLKEERKTYFSDLSSDSARSLFSKFVEKWNSKELDIEYYEGIATAPRTSHKWNIKKWYDLNVVV